MVTLIFTPLKEPYSNFCGPYIITQSGILRTTKPESLYASLRKAANVKNKYSESRYRF